MKVGVRKPSIKKSVKARTTGKVKRAVKSSYNPTYGKKGMGMINDPKKAVYNKVYDKTTVGVRDLLNYDENNEFDEYDESIEYNINDCEEDLGNIMVDMSKIKETSKPKKYYEKMAEKYEGTELMRKKKTCIIIAIISFIIYLIGAISGNNDICPFFFSLTIVFCILAFRRHKTITYVENEKNNRIITK